MPMEQQANRDYGSSGFSSDFLAPMHPPDSLKAILEAPLESDPMIDDVAKIADRAVQLARADPIGSTSSLTMSLSEHDHQVALLTHRAQCIINELGPNAHAHFKLFKKFRLDVEWPGWITRIRLRSAKHKRDLENEAKERWITNAARAREDIIKDIAELEIANDRIGELKLINTAIKNFNIRIAGNTELAEAAGFEPIEYFEIERANILVSTPLRGPNGRFKKQKKKG